MRNKNTYWRQTIRLHMWKWLAYGKGDKGLRDFLKREALMLRSQNREKGS